MTPPRVISLVPSLTETCIDLGLAPSALLGRTPWCTRPRPEVDRIPVVGGTKTPNLERILALAPDVVLLDAEENPREVHDRLVDAGIGVFVSRVRAVAEVPAMLRELGAALGLRATADARAEGLETALAAQRAHLLTDARRPRALPLIWHEPLMALEATRYGGDLVREAGFHVPEVAPEGNGYPAVSVEKLAFLGCEHLLFTSEPHDFQPDEIEPLTAQVARLAARPVAGHKVDGEALTWFGSRSQAGLAWFVALRRRILDGAGARG